MRYQPTLFGMEELSVKTEKRTKEEIFNDYEGFTEKFKPKKTTDDCYTPPEIYQAVLDWVQDNISPLQGITIRRPFKPGGDYQAEATAYGSADVVIDNPPFSILAKIIDFYIANGIRFFLFAPALTLFGTPRPGVTYICASGDITYENGATVKTSFVTNMEGKHRIIVAGDLCKKIREVSDMLRKRNVKKLTKWNYPNEVITAALMGKFCTRGIVFKIPMEDVHFIRKLDNAHGSLFGGGYLLSERAAAERAAAERAAAERARAYTVELSDRERGIIERLNNKSFAGY